MSGRRAKGVELSSLDEKVWTNRKIGQAYDLNFILFSEV